MPARPLLLIAAGGTGGHMFPAQALAEIMLARGWRVKLSTDARGARYAGGFPPEVTVEQTASATFARGGASGRIAAPFRILAGISAAILHLVKDRPAAVIGFGGYPTIPALSAAWALRIPRMIHEQNGILGKVNRLFANHVDAFACGTWPTDLAPSVVGLHTGNPVRATVLDCRGAPYAPPGDGTLHILVIGGSQGARILSDATPAALAMLPEQMRARLRVAHQAREEDVNRTVAAYRDAGIAAEVLPFFNNIAQRLSGAHLVISRSGASSVADISVIGRPSILVPFAAATGDHQTANARGLVDAGAAILIPESRLDSATLASQIAAVLTQPQAAARMAAAAAAQGIPDAAIRLAGAVEALAAAAAASTQKDKI